MERRESLKILAAATFGASLPGCAPWNPEAPAAAAGTGAVVDGTFTGYSLRFFTDAEMKTVRLLADLIIPADDRSGSASDAMVPEFIDFTASDRETMQIPLRGGLAWLDVECRKRFGAPFAECAEADRRAVLDDIAWPDSAPSELSQGVTFFSTFRDLTAAGFFSSRMGVDDLGYQGNVATMWQGCSTEAMNHVGSTYDDQA